MNAHIGTGEAQVRYLHHSPAQHTWNSSGVSDHSVSLISLTHQLPREGGKKIAVCAFQIQFHTQKKKYRFHLFYTISFWEHNSFNSQLRLEKLSSHSQKQSANYISIRYCIFPFAIHKFLTAANCGSVKMRIYFLQINILQRCLLE